MKKVIYILPLLFFSCSKTTPTGTLSPAPFSADSAYNYVAEQVALGARQPGSQAHYACAKYIENKLKAFGAEVSIEQGQMLDYDSKAQQIYNIIGSFNTTASKRILLAAHYDTRPWADQEEDYNKRTIPILGANDGASGVAVLLEIARQLSQQKPTTAIDLVFFDCEDMGTPTFYTGKEKNDTWCLGSQLWATMHQKDAQSYKYGIVLDMVGGYDAQFSKEYYSMQYASAWTEKIWHTASKLGYTAYFQNQLTYPITDDHYYVNTIASIPCVDIIHYNTRTQEGFPHYWHTEQDNMNNICKETLQAVGTTVLTTILN